MRKSSSGFTIVELLIVIVVIAILATISIVAYNGVQARARDSKRVSDAAQIKKSLLAYDAIHGGVVRPNVTGYTKPTGEPSMGGWDVSTSAVWLTFLRGSNGTMPVDPVNVITDTTGIANGDNRVYAYYCYNAGDANAFPDSAAVVLRYRTDTGASQVDKFRVTSCLTTIPS
jgi:prepilin-type N-terminal cleavage/methylation domain-containing protein